MKRVLTLSVTVVLVVSLMACSSTETATSPSNAKKLLYVKKNEGSNDPIIISHLKKLGYQIMDTTDSVFKAEAANGYGVVFISDSVNSSRIDAKLKNSTVPVVYAKTQSVSIAGLTGILDYGELNDVKAIQIKDSKHPLAAGLKDQVTVYNSNGKMGYAIPGKEAVIIATAQGDDKKAVIFGYEKGTKNIKNEPIPARQVFFYLPAGQEMNQNDEGWKLLDASIQWAAQNGKK
ncbi:hypothetical protein [Paenibacillus sp. Soil724D2]|uniref:hypothetical protein n=1 Tax=Paenibacillus sp. (strain Soil724D2) TaxID=1736392 RepID=UPI000715A9DB|nr:hypothetical protein [Paenibacillus sp. Soil724D2]KRE32292.1 hypothetical protein ASG85_16480 [Paenibacillus sp. Soil724D2]